MTDPKASRVFDSRSFFCALIVDGLDELNADLKSETGAPGSNRSVALSKLLFGIYRNLHCVVAGRPYSIVDDNWIHLFHFNAPGLQKNGGPYEV